MNRDILAYRGITDELIRSTAKIVMKGPEPTYGVQQLLKKTFKKIVYVE